MNQTKESALLQNGTIFPDGELNRNKINLISGATIPQFCDFFWDTSLRDKELVTRLNSLMQTMYVEGQHDEMMDVLFILYRIVGIDFPEEIKLLSENREALSYFLREAVLDFDDVFSELIALYDAGIE